MNKLRHIVKMFCVVFLSILLINCATQKTWQIKNQEQMLATAGFIIKLANTPEKLAQIKSLKQLELIADSKDGETRYIYVDADVCQCVYEGNERSYQRYQKLTQEKMANDIQFEIQTINQDLLNRM